MSIYEDTEFVPCYKGGRCEDAPCCGCGNDYRYMGEYDAPDPDDFYDRYDDEPFVDDDGPLWHDEGGEDRHLDGMYEE